MTSYAYYVLVKNTPILFLKMLQTAVLARSTQPLTPQEQALSNDFNALFHHKRHWPELAAGAQAGHEAILVNYQTHTLPGTTWITFTDMGAWDQTFQGYLNRSSINEYIQFGNNRTAAGYYHTFLDSNGNPLDGTSLVYTLKFLSGQQPEVSRFWSLTAYTPESIELVRNDAQKYAVASYTPGLVTDPNDGSVTIVMSATRPPSVPETNWLPVPRGKFNLMLRAYGPGDSVVNNSYTPPSVDVSAVNP